jgi:glycosyltransferase involved in cell wall biosynthesis
MFIIHLGTSGFPNGNNAVIQRIRLTFKGLKHAGCNPLILSKHSLYSNLDAKRISRYQGVPYVATSKILYRPDNFLIRNINRLTGYLGELIILIKKRRKIHTAIISGCTFHELVYYRILSKLLGFQLILQYVDFFSDIKERNLFFTHLNDVLLDKYRFYFCDGIIVISEFLKNHTLSIRKSLPLIKIPAICDFEEFKGIEDVAQKDYLMYCGSLGYLPVIEFVIELYTRLRETHCYDGKLLLAIGGYGKIGEFDSLAKKINESGFTNEIVLKTNVPHNELIKMYLGAELLIVPMRNTVQDIAGFHHKIGEYCAAKKPIISNNLGELSYYFKDGVSAILADEYSIESFLMKLQEILPDKDKLKIIAEEGYTVGSEKLNYLNNGILLSKFILNNKKIH